jgi:hypothetical protein
MEQRAHPDLHKRLVIPAEARLYIEKFDWIAHGFPSGRPRNFAIDNRTYKASGPMTDAESIATALCLLIDFEVQIAFEQSMLERWEQ